MYKLNQQTITEEKKINKQQNNKNVYFEIKC